jgi:hypothetical protein
VLVRGLGAEERRKNDETDESVKYNSATYKHFEIREDLIEPATYEL